MLRKKDTARVEDLRLDPLNPRAGGKPFAEEADAVRYLVDHADVRELVSSILEAGWIEFEPLIVEKGTNIVLEGNRRLAALKLIRDASLREELGFEIGEISADAKPEIVSVIKVENREAARSYIAFKHINGPAKWDALAKARYADDWIRSGSELSHVAKSIGDTHNTILRLVNGHRVLLQAQSEGFDVDDITARRFNFSHLYTAIARPSVREYLSLDEDVSFLLPDNPVPETHLVELGQLMGWLYGQSKSKMEHVVKSQNPDLNILVKVLANQEAREMFLDKADLRRSAEVIDPPSNRFTEALRAASHSSERALGLVVHFDPVHQSGLQTTIKALSDTVKAIREQMTKKILGEDE